MRGSTKKKGVGKPRQKDQGMRESGEMVNVNCQGMTENIKRYWERSWDARKDQGTGNFKDRKSHVMVFLVPLELRPYAHSHCALNFFLRFSGSSPFTPYSSFGWPLVSASGLGSVSFFSAWPCSVRYSAFSHDTMMVFRTYALTYQYTPINERPVCVTGIKKHRLHSLDTMHKYFQVLDIKRRVVVGKNYVVRLKYVPSNCDCIVAVHRPSFDPVRIIFQHANESNIAWTQSLLPD